MPGAAGAPGRDMRRLDLDELRQIVAAGARQDVFTTVSGAHLYGFGSRDSDVDLRGSHVLPLRDVVGLHPAPQTITRDWVQDGAEIDLVSHDVGKFFRMLLQRNGYVLEQLLSPLVVTSSDAHAEAVSLVPQIVTVHHAHHYLGFARGQLATFARTGELKPLLYTFRVLLTGIHLMRTGRVEARLPELLAAGSPAYRPELLLAKAEQEHAALVETGTVTRAQVGADVERLTEQLERAAADSHLPDSPTAGEALDDLLIRLRTA